MIGEKLYLNPEDKFIRKVMDIFRPTMMYREEKIIYPRVNVFPRANGGNGGWYEAQDDISNDVVIYCELTARYFQIDLEKALIEKIAIVNEKQQLKENNKFKSG